MTKQILIIGLFIVHFVLLSTIGFSWFGTTLLFFYLTFKILTFFISLIFKRKERRDLVIKNISVLFFSFVIIEFLMLIIFTPFNHFTEKERGFYLSDYKKQTHTKILNYLGQNEKTFTFKEAYYPNSNRLVKKAEFKNTHSYNKEGFRGNFPKIEKNNKEFRIILLGDSFIEGEGADDQQTISVLLEKKLNNISKDPKFSVINGGICGSNPVYEKMLFYKKLLKYKPDLVINNFYVNDIFDVQIMKKNGMLTFSEYLFAVSHIYRFIDLFVFKNKDESEFYTHNVKIKSMNQASLTMIQKSNAAFKDSLSKMGIVVLNTCIPSIRQVENQCMNYKNLLIFDMNILEYWLKEKNPTQIESDYYWEKDGHLKPLGNESIAEILRNKILTIYARTH